MGGVPAADRRRSHPGFWVVVRPPGVSGRALCLPKVMSTFYVPASPGGLTEEAGAAYKNIDDVVEAVHRAGVSRKVVRLIPVGNVKG